jgi:hypothetical protein
MLLLAHVALIAMGGWREWRGLSDGRIRHPSPTPAAGISRLPGHRSALRAIWGPRCGYLVAPNLLQILMGRATTEGKAGLPPP